jgi:hypothetical protein
MEEVCDYIITNIYNKISTIKFIKMDIEDLLNIENNISLTEYIIKKLVLYSKPYKIGIDIKNKTYKTFYHTCDCIEFDIIIYKKYWIVTLYPKEE